MPETFTSMLAWVLLIGGGLVLLFVLVKVPELLVVVLVMGTPYIQWVFSLLGYEISRRTFATAGAVIFIPVVLLIVILRVVQSREREPIIGRPNMPFVLTAMAMGLVLLFGLTYSPSYRYGPQKTGEYFIFGLTPMLLGFVFLRDRAASHRFLWWVLGVSTFTVVLTSAYLLATRGTLFTLIHVWMEGEGESVGRVVRGHSSLSTPMVLAMAALFAMAGGRRGFWWKAAPLLLMPVLGFYLIMSGTRSNLVAFLAVVVAGSFLAYRRQRGILVAAALVLVVSGLFVFLYAPEYVRDRMFFSWFGDEEGEGAATPRLQLATFCLEEGMKSPLVGWGTGSYPTLRGWDQYDYPHNMFAEMFVENGLLGLGVLLALWWMVIARIFTVLRTTPPETEPYGLAIFGGGLMAFELFNGLSHVGLAHHSCTLLITSAIVLRSTFLAEQAGRPEEDTDPAHDLSAPLAVLRAGPL